LSISNMSTRDFFDNVADVGSDEDDEDFDEETGEARPKKTNGATGVEDSSEEEDEDDDELLAQASF
jgi:transcription elongation factor SPT6